MQQMQQMLEACAERGRQSHGGQSGARDLCRALAALVGQRLGDYLFQLWTHLFADLRSVPLASPRQRDQRGPRRRGPRQDPVKMQAAMAEMESTMKEMLENPEKVPESARAQ